MGAVSLSASVRMAGYGISECGDCDWGDSGGGGGVEFGDWAADGFAAMVASGGDRFGHLRAVLVRAVSGVWSAVDFGSVCGDGVGASVGGCADVFGVYGKGEGDAGVWAVDCVAGGGD